MNIYYHCGQMGDIIYSLPTVRALGPGRFLTSLRKDRHDQLEPLLRLQSCIKGVGHFAHGRPLDWNNTPPEVTHDLNLMRMPQYGPLHLRTLVESHALPFGVKVNSIPWLDPEPAWVRGKHNRAVVNRSFRYRRTDIDWRSEVLRLSDTHDSVVFVGLEQEFADFCGRVVLPWKPCKDALDLAQFIYESKTFSGNQSFPLSLAVGYGLPHRIERGPGHTNCNFPDTVEIL